MPVHYVEQLLVVSHILICVHYGQPFGNSPRMTHPRDSSAHTRKSKRDRPLVAVQRNEQLLGLRSSLLRGYPKDSTSLLAFDLSLYLSATILYLCRGQHFRKVGLPERILADDLAQMATVTRGFQAQASLGQQLSDV